MTDFNPTPAGDTPSLVTQIVASVARHGLTAAAGALGTLGVLSTTQQTEFTDVGIALVTGLAAILWSYIQKRNVKKAA